MARTPFRYDPNFFDHLKRRPDIVPRFLGVISDPERLPLRSVPMSSLVAIQDRVDPKKVEAIRDAHIIEHPAVVHIDGKNYVADGHHRASADWLDGRESIQVHWKDLSEHSDSVKAFPRKPSIKVGDLVTVDSDMGCASNAPWTSAVSWAKDWSVRVSYDDGEATYQFNPLDLRDVQRSGRKNHFFFRKAL